MIHASLIFGPGNHYGYASEPERVLAETRLQQFMQQYGYSYELLQLTLEPHG